MSSHKLLKDTMTHIKNVWIRSSIDNDYLENEVLCTTSMIRINRLFIGRSWMQMSKFCFWFFYLLSDTWVTKIQLPLLFFLKMLLCDGQVWSSYLWLMEWIGCLTSSPSCVMQSMWMQGFPCPSILCTLHRAHPSL